MAGGYYAVNSSSDDAADLTNHGQVYDEDDDFYVLGSSTSAGRADPAGYRFVNIPIPQCANIIQAWLEPAITATGGKIDTTDCDITIFGVYEDDADTWDSSTNRPMDATHTTAFTVYNMTEKASTIYRLQETLDVTDICQEIVDKGGWSSGNAMAFIVFGEVTNQNYNSVRFYNYDYSPVPGYEGAQACWLNIQWTSYEDNSAIQIDDDWHDLEAIKINIGDSWATVNSLKINIGDDWKDITI